MTNVGKWTAWYQGLEEPWPYGETTSYEIGAAWLAECTCTEDWLRGGLAEHLDPARPLPGH